MGIGVALLLRPRLKPSQAARRLDQRFHLDEQLATAAEVAARNPAPRQHWRAAGGRNGKLLRCCSAASRAASTRPGTIC
ncbi:MAG: hypothetical protein U0074_05510 [Kouleothrix sp.]